MLETALEPPHEFQGRQVQTEKLGYWIVEVIQPIRLKDSYGRRTSNGQVHFSPGEKAYCRRTRRVVDGEVDESETLFWVLHRSGWYEWRLSPQEAYDCLQSVRRDGQPVPAEEDAQFPEARRRWDFELGR